ncbi:MAG TPA: SH3 domain-containing protein [Candidatus Dojkabacteria bacterium]|nr:SH3 domain-containing protein [Candidatus Dojkabacteria bacterium]
MKKLSHFVFKICLTVFFVLALPTSMYAAEYSREQSGIDTSISDQTTRQFAQPTKIYMIQITTQESLLQKDSRAWFKTLYYYFITRLGYVDLPFTYVVDRDGNVYKGRDGGPNVSPEISGSQGAVVVGYLSNPTDITVPAGDAIKKLVTDLSYTYGIEGKELQTVTMKMIKEDGKSTKSVFTPVNNLFALNIATVIENVKFSDKEHIDYKAEIALVNYEKTVKSGEKLKVTVGIKNNNDFPWFTDKDYIYVSTKGSKNSKFAINGVWDSFSKPVSISKRTVQPGETVNVEFELQALLLPGKQSESYYILRSPSTVFSNTEFKIEFEILKGSAKLVQVTNTPGGVLNVRECPSGNCKSLTQLEEGQVVVMIEKSSAGWYKVRYSESKTGWVYGPYIKEL